MSTPNADAAREVARQDNGQFGTQPLAEANVDLTVKPGSAPHLPSRTGCPTCGASSVAITAKGTYRRHYRAIVTPDGVQQGSAPCEATGQPVPDAKPDVPTETAELPDGDGVGYLVTPGVIDDGARAVYCSGAQSLALARKIHDQTGWPVMVTYRTGPDPELDESEWDDAEKFSIVYEAHAICPYAGMVTINGREEHYPGQGSDFVDAWEYRRELITDTQVLDELDDACEQFPEEEWAATFVDPVLLANGIPGARKPLTAEPSTNPKAAPFGRATTLKELDEHFEALTSPENISWDGERSSTAVQAEFARLNAAYWARRDEIDPKRERSFCTSCRQEVQANATGAPDEHDNGLGRECWGGK